LEIKGLDEFIARRKLFL